MLHQRYYLEFIGSILDKATWRTLSRVTGLRQITKYIFSMRCIAQAPQVRNFWAQAPRAYFGLPKTASTFGTVVEGSYFYRHPENPRNSRRASTSRDTTSKPRTRQHCPHSSKIWIWLCKWHTPFRATTIFWSFWVTTVSAVALRPGKYTFNIPGINYKRRTSQPVQ